MNHIDTAAGDFETFGHLLPSGLNGTYSHRNGFIQSRAMNGGDARFSIDYTDAVWKNAYRKDDFIPTYVSFEEKIMRKVEKAAGGGRISDVSYRIDLWKR